MMYQFVSYIYTTIIRDLAHFDGTQGLSSYLITEFYIFSCFAKNMRQ